MIANSSLTFIVGIVIWLVGAGLTLLALWAIIRGAVLSALRKHASEQRERGQG